MSDKILWSPPSDVAETSRIGQFTRWLSDRTGQQFADYTDLWSYSVNNLGDFWAGIWAYFRIGGPVTGDEALAEWTMPGARWFSGQALNYAEIVLRAPGRDPEDVIVVSRSDSRPTVELTVAELRDQVARCRAGLRRLGVGRGDRVAAYLPNISETVVLLLATASLGAVFSSCAPEFGTRSVVDRWRQIAPTVLVTVDGYRYGDKAVDRRDQVALIRAELPGLRHVVALPYLGEEVPDALPWRELLARPAPPAFDPVPFDHPLYVLYSSGTTGLPKPIVHGHGGITLEHVKNLALHHDLGPDDRFFWFTTTGWMMWNYLVSGPAVGATIVLSDGDPVHGGLGALWRMAERTGTTYFGTSAPFLLACRKAGLVPAEIADLSRLRGIGSTGAPLPSEGFEYVYDSIAPDAMLLSLSGGTDVCTGFVGGAPIVPVYSGEISCRCLGAKVEAFNADGRPVVGEQGELVITAPMPSMPVGFFADDDGSRYTAAYFAKYPGVWCHGDWITVTERGTCLITGRSDATLKRGGVRMGTAEFYSTVEAMDEVVDSLVVHLEDRDRLLLFVVCAEGVTLDTALRKRIGAALRMALSPRHVPDEVHQVAAVPRTLSGKKLEVPVKKILSGTPIEVAAATGALANPESLENFVERARRSGG